MTPTGDGEILIQYMDFNNTSNGSYSWNQIHGDYCTVGIEDHTMTRGYSIRLIILIRMLQCL